MGTSVLGEQTLRLRPGRYRVVASITPAYVRVFGLSAAQASRTLRLVVKDGQYDKAGRRGGSGRPRPADREPTPDQQRRPAPNRPGRQAGRPYRRVPKVGVITEPATDWF